MSDIVIRAENLGKKYIIGHQSEKGRGRYTALRDVVVQNVQSYMQKTRDLLSGKAIIEGDAIEEVWALHDINFEIRQGEAVGIIGRNGAGKSTLLKILSRITEPSVGRVTIRGRVASLLEVGTGFHPELSGRDNVYLNGAILGMTRQEIKRKFDEIVAFAGVERYLDTPVKRYSSGMYVRLAFAVAAHLEPEILVVDEVLAVGDAEFQKKCLGKMGDVSKEGRTVLFVSHNMTAVKALCDSAFLFESGSITGMGDTEAVIAQYLDHGLGDVRKRCWANAADAPHNEILKVHGAELSPILPSEIDQIQVDTPIDVHFSFELHREAILNLSMHVKHVGGDLAFAVVSPEVSLKPGLVEFVCHIPPDLMNDGHYTITMLVVEAAKAIILIDDILAFDVYDFKRTGGWLGKWPGAVRPKMLWDYHMMPL